MVASVAAVLGSGCYHVDGPDELSRDLSWADCQAEAGGQVHVRIHIDGRSWVVIQGDELWLKHFDFAAPGRHMGADHPTVIDGEEWYPEWPFGPPPEEGRDCGGCETVDRFYLKDQLPTSGEVQVELEVIEERGSTTLIAEPTSENGYTIAVELDDNGPSSSVWYEVVVHWAVCSGSQPEILEPGA
jgi:hypothetical protein